VILTASILRIFVPCQGTNVKLPDNGIEMSKHIGVYIIQRHIVVMYTIVILIVHILVIMKPVFGGV
jgi:hypothetical protein